MPEIVAEFSLVVLYGQIFVHGPELLRPGLLWTDAHVAQGFAWAPGVVAFGVPDHDGHSIVRVLLSAAYAPEEATLWAVKTPFEVGVAPLSIGSLAQTQAVALPPGRYDLVFEARAAADAAFALDLHFVPSETPDFAILKQGTELTDDRVLTREADPA